MRQEIPIVVLGADGRPYAGASVYVRTSPGGVDATVYQARTGGATNANPLTTDAQGRVNGWLERGDYAGTISSVAGLGPWVEEFPIQSSNDGHLDLAEIPDGLLTTPKLTAGLRPSSLYRLGVHTARPAANAAGLEPGTIWRSTDKWMEWMSDGATWTLIAADPQPLSAIPPDAPAGPASAPVDGQRISLPFANARGVFRYNAGSASPYKWEAEGAAPLAATSLTGPTGTISGSTAYIAICSIGAMPWKGDYEASIGGGFNGTAGQIGFLTLGGGGVTPADSKAIQAQPSAAGAIDYAARTDVYTLTNVGATVASYGRVNAAPNTLVIYSPFVTMRPIRIGL